MTATDFYLQFLISQQPQGPQFARNSVFEISDLLQDQGYTSSVRASSAPNVDAASFKLLQLASGRVPKRNTEDNTSVRCIDAATVIMNLLRDYSIGINISFVVTDLFTVINSSCSDSRYHDGFDLFFPAINFEGVSVLRICFYVAVVMTP